MSPPMPPAEPVPSTTGRRVAVVVSRDYADLDQVRRFVETLPADTVLVGGGARATDEVALRAARMRGLATDVVEPDRGQYGDDAGYMWKLELVKRANLVVAFWAGERDVARHAINIAHDRGVPVEIHPY